MNVFAAAVYTNAYMPGQRHYPMLTEHEQSLVEVIPHILESYHYVHSPRFVSEMRNDNAKVFIDSGAFSAWTLGTTIDLPKYCQWLHENEDIVRFEDGDMMASVLDGIGDPLQTYRNQLEMEAYGIRPLPCFHFGEDERYLEYYLANYNYITIGGMVGKSKGVLRRWLDRVWEKYMVDGSGRPKAKIHGFGLTSVELMERYPWHSCDSSTWIQLASFGNILTPDYGPVSVSTKSPSAKQAGRHLSTLSPIEKEVVLNMLDTQGFTYDRLSEEYVSRAAYNLWAFTEINERINVEHATEPFAVDTQELF